MYEAKLKTHTDKFEEMMGDSRKQVENLKEAYNKLKEEMEDKHRRGRPRPHGKDKRYGSGRP